MIIVGEGVERGTFSHTSDGVLFRRHFERGSSTGCQRWCATHLFFNFSVYRENPALNISSVNYSYSD